MPNVLVIGLFAISAYLIQCLLGFIQIKHFKNVYMNLRRQGKVAIGRRPGKIRAGTIVMFAIDADGKILEGEKLQGTTILATFKKMDPFNGYPLTELNETSPCMKNENKLVQKTVKDAVAAYKKVQNGEIIPLKESPLNQLTFQLNYLKQSVINKIKGV